jgi:membrane protease YdiL (CAAX protease family)
MLDQHTLGLSDPDVSIGKLHEPRGSLRDLVVFYLGFMAIWTVAVLAVWKLGLLPEPERRWFRTTAWIGAVVIWIVWQRPPSPAKWLGLLPVRPREVALAIIAFSVIFGWNFLQVSILSSPLERLATTPGMLLWSFIGVFVEELLFRGAIQTRLAERLVPSIAIPVAAMLFLVIHIPGWIILSIAVDAPSVVTVFLVGLICGVLRHWGQSLGPAVAMHWASNLGAML